jgi:hypothetical protein
MQSSGLERPVGLRIPRDYASDVAGEQFSDDLYLDFDVPLEPEGNKAFFGRDVLTGLIDGIDDFVQARQPRWERRTHRIGAPVMLACSPWVNDERLLETIESLPGACIVISKLPHSKGGTAIAERLSAVNHRTLGIEVRALSALSEMAPKVDGKPLVVGPYDRIHDDADRLATFRTIGVRKKGKKRPPIAHAKLALVGNICWTDEHPYGGVDDYVWFSARRLWVSSANFTYGSRDLLEVGYWTEDEPLVSAASNFLVRLIGASEDINSPADLIAPEYAPVEFDDAAFAEVFADHEEDSSDRTDEAASEH